MDKSIFVDIEGFDGKYKANCDGVVISLKQKEQKELKPSINEHGYKYVQLWKDNKGKTYKVHQIVAMCFLGHKRCKHEAIVDHIDGDKLNNNYKNLRIVTHRENLTTCFVKNKHTHSSQHAGVSYHASRKKWSASIRIKNKHTFLGRFKTEIEAHEAYQRKLKEILAV